MRLSILDDYQGVALGMKTSVLLAPDGKTVEGRPRTAP